MRDAIIPIGGTSPPEQNNKCKLCNRLANPSQLVRCPRCKKLFCRSCIIEDFNQGEYLICLNCAKRLVSPKKSSFKGKYTPLTIYLSNKAKWKRWEKLSFTQIESIIGKELPSSAHNSIDWWTNENSLHVKAWLSIGWSIKEINQKDKTIIFTRPEILTPKKENKSKKNSFTKLPQYKPRKKKKPSLTRIAIAQARLQNISNKKSSMKKYRGKFQPKSAYEKRLWKTDEKP